MRRMTVLLLAGTILACAPSVYAQSRSVTVAYLRAAITSIDDRTRIDVKGLFDADSGLRIAEKFWLRGKGYSSFSIIDPETKAVFSAAYCKHDSKAFETLIKARGDTLYTFVGERGRGDNKEPAFFVSDVRIDYRSRQGDDKQETQVGPRSYRVIMTDLASSNRTVLVNVELGKPYNLFGTRLVIEEEPPPDPNRILIDAE